MASTRQTVASGLVDEAFVREAKRAARSVVADRPTPTGSYNWRDEDIRDLVLEAIGRAGPEAIVPAAKQAATDADFKKWLKTLMRMTLDARARESPSGRLWRAIDEALRGDPEQFRSASGGWRLTSDERQEVWRGRRAELVRVAWTVETRNSRLSRAAERTPRLGARKDIRAVCAAVLAVSGPIQKQDPAVITAGYADLGAPKTLMARQRLREINPALRIHTGTAVTPHGDHQELADVDVIFGCVDNDGARDLLNQIAVEFAVPYLDIATEILTETTPPIIGGRVVCITPGGACLHCLSELDPIAVANWAKTSTQQAADRRHGYGTSDPSAAVVHLNGLAVNAAVAEFAAWISGIRAPAQFIDIDLDGSLNSAGATPGIRVTPRHPAKASPSCIACVNRTGFGGGSGVPRVSRGQLG